MATITSTASGNWSAGGTWVGGVAPSSTDDVVINGHTITLDSATITCNSLNYNNTSARVLCPAASTRELIATNGFSISSSVNIGAALSGTLVAGQDMTFTGTWAIAGSISSICAATGGTLTLRTVGASQSTNLFTSTNNAMSFIIASSWTGGTLNTYGLINVPYWTGTNTLMTMTGGTWNHYSSGTNYLGLGAMRVCSLATTAALVWTGNTDASSALSSQGIFHFTSTANQSITGDHLNKNATGTLNQNTAIIYAGGSGATITLTGCLCTRGKGLCIYTPAATTINWKNQSLSVVSGDQIHVEMYGGSIDISGLVISNAGKVDFTVIGSGTLTTDTNTSITNTSSSATASCIGSTSLDGKIVTVPNPAPTLPAVGNVTAGEVYGYAATPLTGTGLVLDPSTLATALTSTLNTISSTALARFVTVDTGQTSAAAGSVAALAGGGGITVNAIRDAILNRVLSGNHDTAGTVGKLIQNADVATSTRSTLTSAQVEAALLNDADGQALLDAISAKVQTLFDGGADVPVATLVSLIASQITTDHGSGSYVRNTEPDNATIATTASAVNAIGAIVTAIQTILTGITSLGNWLRLIARKGFTNSTALGELNTGGTSAYDATTDSLEAIRDRGDAAWVTGSGGGGGSGGTNSLSVTVTDASGGAPIPNAQVDLFSGSVLIDTQTTDVNGQCTVHADNGTYTLITTAVNYASDDRSITLTGNANSAVPLSSLGGTPPAQPSQCEVSIMCVDEHGVKQAGVTVTATFIAGPDDGTGVAYSDESPTAVSDGNGIAKMVVPRKCTYDFSRETGPAFRDTVPDAATGTVRWLLGPGA